MNKRKKGFINIKLSLIFELSVIESALMIPEPCPLHYQY
jgi:hypothetical protein